MRIETTFRFGRLLSAVAVFLIAAALSVGGATQASAEDTGDWFARAFKSKSEGRISRLGGPVSETRQRSRSKGVQVASLGNSYVPAPKKQRSLSGGGGVNWVANAGCLSSNLRGVIHSVASSYGSVTVSSTCRNHAHNARVGGAPKSHHLTGGAADFRVHGNWGAAANYLRSAHGGGFKHYGGGLFHIDNGAKRTW